MTQRISLNEVHSQVRLAMARNYSALFRSQIQLDTGKRIQRPSDDPVGTRRILGIQDQQEALARFLESAEGAQSALDTGASALQDVSTSATRIRELATAGANGTLSAADRNSYALEIDALVSSLVGAGNTRFQGRYLFAGTATTTEPFAIVAGQDGLTRVDYRGNEATQRVEIGPGIFMPLNLPGSAAFPGGTRGATTFRGTTGATPGAGIDSGSGRDALQLVHTNTLLGATPGPQGQDPVTGLRPGTSSAALDTILGPGHVLTISTDAFGNGSISLDGGADTAFTAGATNVLVAGPNGEIAYLDVSGVLPNIAGAVVGARGEGTLSTDGGASTVVIDFNAPAQQVVDEETGSVLHVDARAIRISGTENVTYGGTFDLFSAALAIRDTLRDPTLTGAERSELLNLRLADLDSAIDGSTGALSALGSRSSHIDRTRNQLQDLGVTLAEHRSATEDADIASVVVDLRTQETLYQSSLMMAARISQLSLLNYL